MHEMPSALPKYTVHAYHDREDQGHDVDGICGTKAGEYSQTKVATEWRWRFMILYKTMVKKCTPTQGTFHLRI